MSPLHQLYFDVVHKILIPRKVRRTKANYLDLTVMEILDTEVKIDLPSLIIKHMQRVLSKDENGHALPYAFWLSRVFEDYSVPVQVWTFQKTKDVLVQVKHVDLPASMRRADTPFQRMRIALAEKSAEFMRRKLLFRAKLMSCRQLLSQKAANVEQAALVPPLWFFLLCLFNLVLTLSKVRVFRLSCFCF